MLFWLPLPGNLWGPVVRISQLWNDIQRSIKTGGYIRWRWFHKHALSHMQVARLAITGGSWDAARTIPQSRTQTVTKVYVDFIWTSGQVPCSRDFILVMQWKSGYTYHSFEPLWYEYTYAEKFTGIRWISPDPHSFGPLHRHVSRVRFCSLLSTLSPSLFISQSFPLPPPAQGPGPPLHGRWGLFWKSFFFHVRLLLVNSLLGLFGKSMYTTTPHLHSH